MKKNPLWTSIVVSGCCLLAFIQVGQVTAQQLQNMTNIQTNQTTFTELFQQKYARNLLDAQVNKQYERDTLDYNLNSQVSVEYESPTSILISGHLITHEPDLIFNTFLFQGMDLLKNQYGFKIQDVFTSGEGNKANPTKVYILLTK